MHLKSLTLHTEKITMFLSWQRLNTKLNLHYKPRFLGCLF